MDGQTIAYIIAAIGCVIGIAGWLRNSNSDAGEQAASNAVLATKLDGLTTQNGEMKTSIDKLDGKVDMQIRTQTEMQTRLVKIEEGQKTQWRLLDDHGDRIDALEGRCNG